MEQIRNDVYNREGIWDLEKVQIYPVGFSNSPFFLFFLFFVFFFFSFLFFSPTAIHCLLFLVLSFVCVEGVFFCTRREREREISVLIWGFLSLF